MADTSKVSIWAMFLLFPSLSCIWYFIIETIWSASTLPSYFPNFQSFDYQSQVNLMCSISTCPLAFLYILSVIIKSLSRESDLSISTNNTLDSLLSNTLEHTFMYILNLLSAGILAKIPNIQLVLCTFVFICARILYVFGYLIGLRSSALFRIPGLGLSVINTLVLTYKNLCFLDLFS
ncbi:hypothetical protein SteCoe_4611 [Stentor coeruleus]|uniref:MAPEG family protein n=1 Tax=Stentor coeruleus TaxID=5963 RepID=A0A1R2CUE6_9CILI|nr:hypothetical protein SteCoe_4611 [Stentor coeruleus]